MHHAQAQDNTPAVAIEGLRLRYPQDGRIVLHGVDMTLRRGEVKLLLGPSGAGKSSLALTMNGLIPHQMDAEIRGRVLVNGLDTMQVALHTLTSQVGMLFQDPDSQLATLTVQDEVAFGMENLKLPPAEMPERISRSLQRVGLEGLASRSTDALSGGQKQRVALASTLAMGVSILVLDEPTANLDPAGTSSFFRLLARLKSEGTSVLIIEHKLDELVSYIDSIAVLDWDGRITLDGPARDVLRDGRDTLEQLGVWLPELAELANALARRNIVLEPYPLTVSEAAQSLGIILSHGKLRNKPNIQSSIPDDARTNEPIIEVKDLSYSYDDGIVALDGVSLSVSEGDFYAIVGPNGSGKTTLAKHLNGLLRPQHGTVNLRGRNVMRIPASELSRRVAYVFQNPEHQFVALTVFDELAFSMRALKMPENRVTQGVESLLAQFGLEGHRNSNPYTLSQGQKRRLSVATMLALDPQVLILDEPTFGQDHSNATRIMEQLRSLNARGVTIIIITHDMKLVSRYVRKVAVVVRGRNRYEGDVRGLYSDEALVAEAHLEAPPLYRLSQALRARLETFPLLMTPDEFVEEICARSGTCQEAVSFTG